MRTRVHILLLLPLVAGVAQGEETPGRSLLFHDPSESLPDVLLSESFASAAEGTTFTYTAVLTHTPGMREDETINTYNDDVRIYLTSSQVRLCSPFAGITTHII